MLWSGCHAGAAPLPSAAHEASLTQHTIPLRGTAGGGGGDGRLVGAGGKQGEAGELGTGSR